eukprot:jgi/Ulvmu1/10896/UM007_0073.1
MTVSLDDERKRKIGDLAKRILIVTDFFFPNVGGVESHVYNLSQCLMDSGHHVVVMTHAYGNRTGVRYLTNGLKVYYVPRRDVYASATAPTLFGAFRLLRCIVIREAIQLVHAHQAFSVLGNEAALHGRTLGLPVVFTDHSLFGFADAASICTNKLLKWTLCDVQAVVCVSHTSKENTVLRAALPPARVYVVPNAIDMPCFRPFPRPPPPPDTITVVMLSRLVYRKGVDLQVAAIPELCRRHPRLRFLIGGDGPKRADLEAMVRRGDLGERVRLAGAVRHAAVRDLLVQGDIFLNTSLTEAFCMAILEAAAAGLLVTSTNVGGVPEVLPHDLCILAEPEPQAIIDAVSEAVDRVLRCPVDRQAQHDRVSTMYSWHDIARRTEAVYAAAVREPHSGALLPRLPRLLACGRILGLLTVAFSVLDMLWLWVVRWLDPEDDIERAPRLKRPLARTDPQPHPAP